MVAIESSASPNEPNPDSARTAGSVPFKADGPLCVCGHGQYRHYTDIVAGEGLWHRCYDCPSGRCTFVPAGGAR